MPSTPWYLPSILDLVKVTYHQTSALLWKHTHKSQAVIFMLLTNQNIIRLFLMLWCFGPANVMVCIQKVFILRGQTQEGNFGEYDH